MSRIRSVGQPENTAQIETENWFRHTHTEIRKLASVFPANWARFNPVLCGVFYILLDKFAARRATCLLIELETPHI